MVGVSRQEGDMPRTEMMAVQNVNVPGYKGNVNAEKYRAMRQILLKILPKKGPGITQAEMGRAVLPYLPQNLWPNGERSMWWVKTVQLDLEAKGLVIRDASTKPLRWHQK
jgi:nitrogenase molybdenum-iron protein alpha/beta subunit